MFKYADLRRRSFLKSLPLRKVEDKDAQFVLKDTAKGTCIEASIPIISVGTQKKEITETSNATDEFTAHLRKRSTTMTLRLSPAA